MTSRLRTFRARSILWAFVVPKCILLFTKEGRKAQPYSINFAQKIGLALVVAIDLWFWDKDLDVGPKAEGSYPSLHAVSETPKIFNYCQAGDEVDWPLS